MKIIASILLCASLLTSQFPVLADNVDLEVIHRIKDQAFNQSHVMDYMHILADANGPRVTGSPGYRRAAENSVKAMKAAGLSNARIEPWGIFGRDWSWSRIAVQMKTPVKNTVL